jgi:hypothetical protein
VKGKGFFEVAKAHLGLHSTDYWTPYLSVWARIGGYDAERVYTALNTGDRLIRLNSFRRTVHVIHTDNVPLVVNATGKNMFNVIKKNPLLKKYTDAELEVMIARIEERLESGIATTREMKKDLSDMDKEFRWVLLLAMARGTVVRATASHARSSLTSYALLSKWGKGVKIPRVPEEEAIAELTKKFIEVYGPVTVNDIAWWFPLTKTASKKAINALGEGIVEVEIDGIAAFMTRNDLEVANSLKKPETPMVWLLPYEDHLPKAFVDRSWYLSEEMRERVFPKLREHYRPPKGPPPPKEFKVTGGINVSGEIRPSIWVDGEIVGRWEFEEKEGKMEVVYSIFTKVHPKYDNIISKRVSELEAFVNERLVPISKSK